MSARRSNPKHSVNLIYASVAMGCLTTLLFFCAPSEAEYPPPPPGAEHLFGNNHYYPLRGFGMGTPPFNGCAQEGPGIDTISRISRGGPPNSPAAIHYLQRQGVTHILDVRGGGEGRDGGSRAGAGGNESQWANDAHFSNQEISYIHWPLSGHLEDRISRAVDRIHEILLSDHHARVYIHCQHGADRTGTIIAAYEARYGGCDCPVIEREMIRFQFSVEYFQYTAALRNICTRAGRAVDPNPLLREHHPHHPHQHRHHPPDPSQRGDQASAGRNCEPLAGSAITPALEDLENDLDDVVARGK